MLVTGAAGFVASHLIRALSARGSKVFGLLKPSPPEVEAPATLCGSTFDPIAADLRNPESVRGVVGEVRPDLVFHLAAETIVRRAEEDPVGTYETNVRGTYHLIEACATAKSVQAFVMASSDKAYGASDELPYTEATPLRARSVYEC